MGPPFLTLWRCRGGWLPPGGMVSCGDAPPIFFSILRKRKRAVHGPKEKGAWTRSGTFVPPRCTGVGGSVQAPVWAFLRARYDLLRIPNCRPVADGAEGIGVVDGFDLLLFPRVPLYPQGVRRIRKAAEPPTAAQLLGAAWFFAEA